MTTELLPNNDKRESGENPNNSSLPEEYVGIPILKPELLPIPDDILKNQEMAIEEKANSLLKLNITALRP